jgi:hypothetical protein
MKYAIATALTLISGPVFAQANCAAFEDVKDILSQKYGERRHIGAMNDRNLLVEIWGNEETGTWTAIIVRPDGIACIVDQGQQFYASEREEQKPGEEM